MVGQVRTTYRRLRATARNRDDRCRRDRRGLGRAERARPRRSGPTRDGSSDRVRCLRDADGDDRTFGTARRGTQDARRSAVDASRCDRSRPPLPIPRLRSTSHMVRRPSRRALGGRRVDGSSQPRPTLPASSPVGARTRGVSAGATRRTPGVQTAGRVDPREPSTAVGAGPE